MEQISLVTAKVVRENEQYAYKLVGKGEKYLVRHQDGDNAGDKVLAYLSPYAKEPVCIEAVALQKNIEFVNPEEPADHIYKCAVEYSTLNEETGKEQTVRKSYYVYADTVRGVMTTLEDVMRFNDVAITSISRTKIIELL